MCEPTAPKVEMEIPGIDRTDIGSILFVTTYKYYLLMVENLQKGTCPFCQINPEVNKVLYNNDSWRIWQNPVPGKKHQALHLVVAHTYHLTGLDEFKGQDGVDLIDAIKWANDNFNIPGGGIMMRFGDPLLNAGTIRHLHFNIQVPDGTGKLEITLAKDQEKMAWHRSVITVFEKMRTGTPFEKLDLKEQELVRDRLG